MHQWQDGRTQNTKVSALMLLHCYSHLTQWMDGNHQVTGNELAAFLVKDLIMTVLWHWRLLIAYFSNNLVYVKRQRSLVAICKKVGHIQ